MAKKEYELLEFTIPNWALPSLINGDDSGLEDEDIEKLDKFVKETIAEYGNANFMLPRDEEMDLGFQRRNDIDNLGSDCSLLYLRPSKKYDAGGETDDKEVVELTPIYTRRDKKGFRYYSTDDGKKLYAEKNGEIYNVSEETMNPMGVVPLGRSRFKFVGLINDSDIEGMNPLQYEKEAIKRVEKSFGLKNGGETDDDEMEEDENEKRLQELADEYDIPTEVIQEYASDRGIEISEITDLPYNGRYDSEEAYAEQMVDDGVITDLSYYLEMYPTDMRILAQEEADRRVDDLDDDDLLREADMEDEANEHSETREEISDLEEEISDLKSEIDDLFEDEDEDTTEGELEEKEQKAKELRDELNDKENDLDRLQDRLASLDSYDEVVDKAREELREQYYDDIYDALKKDAVGYFVDELGYNVEDLATNNLFSVDYEKLARELGYDVNYIYHDGEVYVFSNYERGGMTYAKGGGIPNNYRGKTTDDIWNMLTENQRLHFLFDHAEDLKVKTNQIPTIAQKNWNDLSEDVKEEFKLHTMMGQYAKGGNIPTIEKRVAEVNKLIQEGNDKDVEVIDSSSTWESPMKYKPLKYSNGVLYIEYEELDLYKYNKGMGTEWKTKKDKIAKSGMGVDDQKETLTYIARMYRKAIKHFDTYGYADGGMMAGGGVTFDDKVDSISKALLKRKKVSPSVQKDYGKTYTKKEAIESAKRIAGAIRKKESAKKKS